MLQATNTYTKALAFPQIEVAFAAGETKDVSDEQATLLAMNKWIKFEQDIQHSKQRKVEKLQK